MKKAILAAAAAGALTAAPALANDWTGFYAGINLGSVDVDTSVPGVGNDDTSYGVHVGYDYDLGNWVVGAEFEYDWTDVQLIPGAVSVDSVMRFKGKVGYDLGSTLLYFAAGSAEADVAGLGDDWGGFYGVGIAYQVSSQASLSLEILEHDFNNIAGTGINADATSISARASFRF